jgi:rhodanese-related sulfurtransferase
LDLIVTVILKLTKIIKKLMKNGIARSAATKQPQPLTSKSLKPTFNYNSLFIYFYTLALKMRFAAFKILLLFAFCVISQAQPTDSVKYQSLEQYDFHLQFLRIDPALLIDVRQFFEFKGRRIRDAINIPSGRDLNMAIDTISKNCSLFLYCTDGFRSRRAAEILYDKGYRKLYNLEGGIIAWKRDGFPIVKGKIKRKKK